MSTTETTDPGAKLLALAETAEARAAAASRRTGSPQTWGPGAAAMMRETAARLDGKPSPETWPPSGDHGLAGDLFLALREAGVSIPFAAEAQRAACPCGLCHPEAT